MIKLVVRCALYACLGLFTVSCALPSLDYPAGYNEEEVERHDERYTLSSGVTFLPPPPPPSGDHWMVRKYFYLHGEPLFDPYVFSGKYRETQENFCCYVYVDIRTPQFQTGGLHWQSLDALFRKKIAKHKKENQRRRDLLQGTPNDHWQQERRQKTLQEMAGNLKMYNEEGNLVPVSSLSEEEQWAFVQDRFMKTLYVDRARSMYVPNNYARFINIKGKRCLANYEHKGIARLVKPEDPKPRNIGVSVWHEVSCVVGQDPVKGVTTVLSVLVVANILRLRNEEFDLDAVIAPILESIEWPK